MSYIRDMTHVLSYIKDMTHILPDEGWILFSDFLEAMRSGDNDSCSRDQDARCREIVLHLLSLCKSKCQFYKKDTSGDKLSRDGLQNVWNHLNSSYLCLRNGPWATAFTRMRFECVVVVVFCFFWGGHVCLKGIYCRDLVNIVAEALRDMTHVCI
jgi:hypothetical protein